MALDILLAGVLIAFGIMTVYFTIEQRISDQKLMAIFVLGLLCVGAGLYVLIKTVTLVVILRKLAGVAVAAVGLFFVVGFPDVRQYQRQDMSRTGAFIGIVMLVIGIWLLFF